MNKIYPLTIFADRYNGAYSGGAFIAVPVRYTEIENYLGGDPQGHDTEASEIWIKAESDIRCFFGRGESPEIAVRRLQLMLELNDEHGIFYCK